MKTFRVVAAIAAVLSFAGVAHASSASTDATGGHYEWRLSPTYGPRAPLAAPQRVWVPEVEKTAMFTPGGHYEWQSGVNFGPRASFAAPRRVWVPDHAQARNGGVGTQSAMKPASSASVG